MEMVTVGLVDGGLVDGGLVGDDGDGGLVGSSWGRWWFGCWLMGGAGGASDSRLVVGSAGWCCSW